MFKAVASEISKTWNVLEALWVCSYIGCIVEQKPHRGAPHVYYLAPYETATMILYI